MKFSEWTKRADSHIIDSAAGSHYEQLPQTSKKCIDSAVDRFIHFCDEKNNWDDELIKYINQRKGVVDAYELICKIQELKFNHRLKT